YGLLRMDTSVKGEPARVGLSARNVLARNSDPQLAHQLLLTRISHVLISPKHSRETMLEFVQDWSALQDAADKHVVALARDISVEKVLKRTSSSNRVVN